MTPFAIYGVPLLLSVSPTPSMCTLGRGESVGMLHFPSGSLWNWTPRFGDFPAEDLSDVVPPDFNFVSVSPSSSLSLSELSESSSSDWFKPPTIFSRGESSWRGGFHTENFLWCPWANYQRQAVTECELVHEWLPNNNHISIYYQFCDHLVLLREENYYPYHPLQFPDNNNEESASIHH